MTGLRALTARIKRLEDQLIRERATCIELGRAASTGRFKPVEPTEEAKQIAESQLRREGKIA